MCRYTFALGALIGLSAVLTFAPSFAAPVICGGGPQYVSLVSDLELVGCNEPDAQYFFMTDGTHQGQQRTITITDSIVYYVLLICPNTNIGCNGATAELGPRFRIRNSKVVDKVEIGYSDHPSRFRDVHVEVFNVTFDFPYHVIQVSDGAFTNLTVSMVNSTHVSTYAAVQFVKATCSDCSVAVRNQRGVIDRALVGFRQSSFLQSDLIITSVLPETAIEFRGIMGITGSLSIIEINNTVVTASRVELSLKALVQSQIMSLSTGVVVADSATTLTRTNFVILDSVLTVQSGTLQSALMIAGCPLTSVGIAVTSSNITVDGTQSVTASLAVGLAGSTALTVTLSATTLHLRRSSSGQSVVFHSRGGANSGFLLNVGGSSIVQGPTVATREVTALIDADSLIDSSIFVTQTSVVRLMSAVAVRSNVGAVTNVTLTLSSGGVVSGGGGGWWNGMFNGSSCGTSRAHRHLRIVALDGSSLDHFGPLFSCADSGTIQTSFLMSLNVTAATSFTCSALASDVILAAGSVIDVRSSTIKAAAGAPTPVALLRRLRQTASNHVAANFLRTNVSMEFTALAAGSDAPPIAAANFAGNLTCVRRVGGSLVAEVRSFGRYPQFVAEVSPASTIVSPCGPLTSTPTLAARVGNSTPTIPPTMTLHVVPTPRPRTSTRELTPTGIVPPSRTPTTTHYDPNAKTATVHSVTPRRRGSETQSSTPPVQYLNATNTSATLIRRGGTRSATSAPTASLSPPRVASRSLSPSLTLDAVLPTAAPSPPPTPVPEPPTTETPTDAPTTAAPSEIPSTPSPTPAPVDGCRPALTIATFPVDLEAEDIYVANTTTGVQPSITIRSTLGHPFRRDLSISAILVRATSGVTVGSFVSNVWPRTVSRYIQQREGAAVTPLLPPNTDRLTIFIELSHTPDYFISIEDVVTLSFPLQLFEVPEGCESGGGFVARGGFVDGTFNIRISQQYALVREVADAAQASTAVATSLAIATGGGGAASDAQQMAVLANMACASADMQKSGDSMSWMLSPFYEYGAETIVLGNMTLTYGIFVLHFLAAQIMYLIRRKRITAIEAEAMLRFPALSIVVSLFFLQGAAMASVMVLTNVYTGKQPSFSRESPLASLNPSPTVRIAVGSLGMLHCLFISACFGIVAHRFVRNDRVVQCVSYSPVIGKWPAPLQMALPTGMWMPQHSGQRFGPCFKGFRQELVMLSVLDPLFPVLTTVIATVDMGLTKSGCEVQFSVLAGMYLAYGFVFAIFRPMRIGIMNIYSALSNWIFGGITICAAAQFGMSPTTAGVAVRWKAILLLGQLIVMIMSSVTKLAITAIEQLKLSKALRKLIDEKILDGEDISAGTGTVVKGGALSNNNSPSLGPSGLAQPLLLTPLLGASGGRAEASRLDFYDRLGYLDPIEIDARGPPPMFLDAHHRHRRRAESNNRHRYRAGRRVDDFDDDDIIADTGARDRRASLRRIQSPPRDSFAVNFSDDDDDDRHHHHHHPHRDGRPRRSASSRRDRDFDDVERHYHRDHHPYHDNRRRRDDRYSDEEALFRQERRRWYHDEHRGRSSSGNRPRRDDERRHRSMRRSKSGGFLGTLADALI